MIVTNSRDTAACENIPDPTANGADSISHYSAKPLYFCSGSFRKAYIYIYKYLHSINFYVSAHTCTYCVTNTRCKSIFFNFYFICRFCN